MVDGDAGDADDDGDDGDDAGAGVAVNDGGGDDGEDGPLRWHAKWKARWALKMPMQNEIEWIGGHSSKGQTKNGWVGTAAGGKHNMDGWAQQQKEKV